MSPCNSFLLIEGKQLKKLRDDNTIPSSLLTDLQRYISLILASIAARTKFQEMSILSSGSTQNHEHKVSLASSIGNISGCLFRPLFDFISWIYIPGNMDFRIPCLPPAYYLATETMKLRQSDSFNLNHLIIQTYNQHIR